MKQKASSVINLNRKLVMLLIFLSKIQAKQIIGISNNPMSKLLTHSLH